MMVQHKKVEEEYQDMVGELQERATTCCYLHLLWPHNTPTMVGELQERLKRSLAEARGLAAEQEGKY